MKNMKHTYKINGTLVLFFIAFSGSIFFFPISLGERYTCLYHRLFNSHDQVNENTKPTSSYDKGKRKSELSENYAGNDLKNDEAAVQDNSSEQKESGQELISAHGSVLLDKYIHYYAFPWWISVALTALSIFLWKRLKRDYKKNQSDLNSFIV